MNSYYDSCFSFLSGNYIKGECIAGCVPGGVSPELGIRGAYSEYVVQEASLVFRYPSTISPESAATIPLATITAALGLFHEMKLPLPPANSGKSIVIWSGSTSVGQYAIQLAKAAGCFVITTGSSARHRYLKELGADVCFDYKDPDVVSKIKKVGKDNLAYGFDCISEKGSTKQVCAALTGQNSQVVTLLPIPPNEVSSHIKEHFVLMYSIYGYEINAFRKVFPAKPQDKEFAEKFYKLLSNVLLPQGLLKPNRVTKIPGGLNGVEEGFKRMMENRVAAEKLVYTLAETTKPHKLELNSNL
jgi:NADPH:quinone reductase-like Zn-dependent oxidoreductase